MTCLSTGTVSQPGINNRLRRLTMAATLMSCLFLLACQSPEERVAAHLAAAEAMMDEGNLVKAELEARNALQRDPQSVEAQYLLARLAESRGDFMEMAARLRAAIELQPDYVDARVRLGTIYVLGGALDLARQQLTALEDLAPPPPDDVLVDILRARVQAASGELAAAEAQLRQVLRADPGNAQAVGLLANIVAASDLQAAIVLVDQGIAASSDNRALRLLRIQLLGAAGNDAEVEREYKALIDENPEQIAYVFQLARIYADAGRIEDVEKLLRDLVQRRPDETSARLALVQFVGSVRGIDASQTLLEEFLAERPNDHELRLVLAQLYQAEGREADAIREYENVIRRAANDNPALTAKTRIAALRLNSGDVPAGEALVDEVLLLDPQNSEALLLRAAIKFDRDELRPAVTDLRSLLRTDPNNFRAQLLLARTHSKAGDNLLARDAYRRALEITPQNPAATQELVGLLINENDFTGAERLLRGQLAANPDDAASTRTLIALMLNRQRFDDAEAVASALAERPTQAAIGYYLLAGVYQQRQQPDRAIDALRRSLDTQPNAREPLQAYVSILLQQDRAAEARQYLDKLTREQPDNLFARTLLAQVMAGTGEREAAARIFETTLADNEAWLPAYTGLAGLLGGDSLAQIDVYKRGLEALPGSQELALLLGTAYERNGQIDDAIQTYENALRADPGMELVANNLAALLADYRQDPASLQRALDLSQGFAGSNNAAFLDTLGWVYYRLGEYSKAEPLLKQAVSLAEQVPVLRYHLGMNYYALGRSQLAIEELSAATREGAGEYPGRDEAEQVLKKLQAAN